MPLRHRALTAAALVALLSGCSSEGSLVFGDQPGVCQATVLRNDVGDAEKVEIGSACFFGEVDAGRAVVWDVLIPTVEGDPVPTRYNFDGDETIITTDTSRDSFGNSGVIVQRCQSVQSTGFLPEGLDCVDATGEGFESNSLPLR